MSYLVLFCSDVEEVGSSRETSPLQLLEELCFRRGGDERTALPTTKGDERTAISPGTVSNARRKFEPNNNNKPNSSSSNNSSDVESDKFARERSSTEKLRGILQAESEGSGGLPSGGLSSGGLSSGGLSSVSLLLLGSRQQEEGGGDAPGELSPLNQIKVNIPMESSRFCLRIFSLNERLK